MNPFAGYMPPTGAPPAGGPPALNAPPPQTGPGPERPQPYVQPPRVMPPGQLPPGQVPPGQLPSQAQVPPQRPIFGAPGSLASLPMTLPGQTTQSSGMVPSFQGYFNPRGLFAGVANNGG